MGRPRFISWVDFLPSSKTIYGLSKATQLSKSFIIGKANRCYSPQVLHGFDEMNLLLREHSGEYLSPLDQTVEQLFVVIADHAEGFAVAGENVVAFLYRSDIFRCRL